MENIRESLLKKIEDAKYNLGQNSKSIFLKRQLKKCYNDLDKFDRNEEKKKYGITLAKSIFKKNGIMSVQYSTTSIRGFNTLKRSGYEIQNNDVRFIVFRSVKLENVLKVAEELKTQGFVLERVNESCILIKSYSFI